MKTSIFIPARYASTRYPGKPLAELKNGSGETKTLIQLSWEAALQVRNIHSVHVVTDDERIRVTAEGFGADVIMTSADCENGTARCASALMYGDVDCDLVINLQGDAPLTPASFIEDLIAVMQLENAAQVATPVLKCDKTTYNHFMEDRKEGRVGGTTVVFDRMQNALYFSKEVIPFLDSSKYDSENIAVYHHVGVYAYRPDALKAYTTWSKGILEDLEGLEQLRFLENGVNIRCVKVDSFGKKFWELNNPEDVERIEAILKDQ